MACVIGTFNPEINFESNLSSLKEKLSEQTIEDNIKNIQVINNMREWSYNVFSKIDILKVGESYYQQKLLKIKVDNEIESTKNKGCNNDSESKKHDMIQGCDNDCESKKEDEVMNAKDLKNLKAKERMVRYRAKKSAYLSNANVSLLSPKFVQFF